MREKKIEKCFKAREDTKKGCPPHNFFFLVIPCFVCLPLGKPQKKSSSTNGQAIKEKELFFYFVAI